MIVDCHTHLTNGTDSSEHWEGAEPVDACIVLATAGESNEEANKKVAEYVSNHTDKMVGFAVMDPRKDNISVDGVAAVTEGLGLKGVVLYCSGSDFHPCHSRAMMLYSSVAELGLPLFFHNGGVLGTDAVLDYAQPYLLDEVARAFGSMKIIIGSMGLPFAEQSLAMVSKHENVYADLTVKAARVWEIYNIVLGAHERGVMDKLLFGSGFPFGKASECIETLLGFNKLLSDTNLPSVPLSTIRSVIERNSLELLGIEK